MRIFIASVRTRATKLHRSIALSLYRSIAQSLNHSITQSLNHSITQSLNHSITQSLNHIRGDLEETWRKLGGVPWRTCAYEHMYCWCKHSYHGTTGPKDHRTGGVLTITYHLLPTPNHPITQSPNHPITQSPNHPIAQSPNRPSSHGPMDP